MGKNDVLVLPNMCPAPLTTVRQFPTDKVPENLLRSTPKGQVFGLFRTKLANAMWERGRGWLGSPVVLFRREGEVMKKFWELVGATALGGLAILLPLLLLYVLLDEVLSLIVALATPIADLILPKSVSEAIHSPVLFALLLLLGTSILLGLAARTQAGRRAGRLIERNTVERLPVYAALKGIGEAIVGGKSRAAFEPVLVNYEDGSTVIAYLVENLDDDRVVVLEPWAPTPFAGSVKIVPRDRVRRIEAGLGDVTGVLSRWGVGTRSLLSSGELRPVSTQSDELSG